MVTHKNIIICMLLSRLLNHNYDLINLIIQFKNTLEIEDIKDFYIENNFYNWLNHDLKKRQRIDLNRFNVHQLEKGIISHYDKYSANLGLNNGYRRVKGLNECFQSKWWKYTFKNSIEWKLIHKSIKSDICIYHSKDMYAIDTRIKWERVLNVKSRNIINKLFIDQSITSKNISFVFVDPLMNPFYIEYFDVFNIL